MASAVLFYGIILKPKLILSDKYSEQFYCGQEEVPDGGITVIAEKKTKTYMGLPKKSYWHLYSLQTLQSEKLAKIVNKVLKKEYILIK